METRRRAARNSMRDAVQGSFSPAPGRPAQRPVVWFLLLTTILAASVALPMPAGDGDIAHVPSICPFYNLTGLPCPFCGLTRAFVCLGHGQIRQSLHWHPLGWLLYAAAIASWLTLFPSVIGKQRTSLSEVFRRRHARPVGGVMGGGISLGAGRVAWTLTILFLVVGVVRMALVADHAFRWP